MILRSLLRPQRALQASAKSLTRQWRPMHYMPILKTHGVTYREDGIPPFLSKEAYWLAWIQYQGMLVTKLNALTYTTVDDGVGARDLVQKYAHDASNATLFNYASMAGNNQFFFERLHPNGVEPTTSMLASIKESFGSMDTLKKEMIETADAMFGNGFVWLFKEDVMGLLRIFCTYNAGSPWPDAHHRVQDRDMANHYAQVGKHGAEEQRLKTVNGTAGKFGNHSRPPGQLVEPSGGITGGPILCVNVWQHMYLLDYGVEGKRKYLNNWWKQIDWWMVEQSAHNYGQNYQNTRGGDLSRRVTRSFNRF